MSIGEFVNGPIGQFIIGGTTVAGIGYFSKTLPNPAIAAVIAAVPIGLPSVVFVPEKKVSGYAENLMYMTIVLLIVSTLFWALHNKFKVNRNTAISITMGVWVLIASIYVILKNKRHDD